MTIKCVLMQSAKTMKEFLLMDDAKNASRIIEHHKIDEIV